MEICNRSSFGFVNHTSYSSDFVQSVKSLGFDVEKSLERMRSFEKVRLMIQKTDFTWLPIANETAFNIINIPMNNIDKERIKISASRKNTIKIESSPEIPFKILFGTEDHRFTIKLELIGEGSVKKVTDYFIINTLMHEAISKQIIKTDFQKYYTRREVKILYELKGIPNILQILWENLYKSKKGKLIQLISTEYCDLGNLFEYLNKLNKQEKDHIALQMLKVVKLLHDKGYLHRDIKTDNFFLGSVGPNGEKGPYLVLGDFAYACYQDNVEDVEIACGTPEYIAPEIYEGDDTSVATDTWSTGVTLYVLYNKKLPFKVSKDQTKMHKYIENYIQNAKEPANKKSVDFLIWKFLQPAKNRITISEAERMFEGLDS